MGARGFRANVDQSTANRMVAAALDAGMNLFDTADVYSAGASEEMLGRALSAAGAENALVATKVGNRMSPDRNDRGLSYRHVVSSCEASLRRLGREAIDLYQLHMPDFQTPLEETLRGLDDLRRRGLIRYAGLVELPRLVCRRKPRDCRRTQAKPRSSRLRCTTRWWAGSWSWRCFRRAATPVSAYWSGVRSPAAT